MNQKNILSRNMKIVLFVSLIVVILLIIFIIVMLKEEPKMYNQTIESDIDEIPSDAIAVSAPINSTVANVSASLPDKIADDSVVSEMLDVPEKVEEVGVPFQLFETVDIPIVASIEIANNATSEIGGETIVEIIPAVKMPPEISDYVIYNSKEPSEADKQNIIGNAAKYISGNEQDNNLTFNKLTTYDYCNFEFRNQSAYNIALFASGIRTDTRMQSEYTVLIIPPNTTRTYLDTILINEKRVPVFVGQAFRMGSWEEGTNKMTMRKHYYNFKKDNAILKTYNSEMSDTVDFMM